MTNTNIRQYRDEYLEINDNAGVYEIVDAYLEYADSLPEIAEELEYDEIPELREQIASLERDMRNADDPNYYNDLAAEAGVIREQLAFMQAAHEAVVAQMQL